MIFRNEGAATAAPPSPAQTPGAGEGGSTAASTPQPDAAAGSAPAGNLGQQLRTTIPPAGTPPAPSGKEERTLSMAEHQALLQKAAEDRNRTISRQGAELERLRKLEDAAKAAGFDPSRSTLSPQASPAPASALPLDGGKDYDALYGEGEFQKLVGAVTQHALSQVNESLDTRLKPIEHERAWEAAKSRNPLVRAILQNPEHRARIEQAAQNPEQIREMLGDENIAGLSAMAMAIAGEQYGQQASDKANAPPPHRPEEAGMGSPPASVPAGTPAPSGPTNLELYQQGKITAAELQKRNLNQFWAAERAGTT